MSTNEPMTQERLDAIREREAKATAGPWDVEGSAYCGPLDTLTVYPVEDGGALAYVQPSWEDAEFIAHAREDVPALLAEVERLRTRAALADAMIDRVARDTAAKEPFTSRRQWEDLPHDERTHLRAHAHRVLAADLTPQEDA